MAVGLMRSVTFTLMGPSAIVFGWAVRVPGVGGAPGDAERDGRRVPPYRGALGHRVRENDLVAVRDAQSLGHLGVDPNAVEAVGLLPSTWNRPMARP